MKVRCKGCKTVFDTDEVESCPGCGARVGGLPKKREAEEARPARPEKADKGEALPAVMRANKKVAGKTCPGCGKAIALGVEVHNCEECQASHHTACWDSSGGCAGECAALKPVKKERSRRRDADDEGGGDEKPCKFCGETIKSVAKKCRHCGEYQSELDRRRNEKSKSNPDDDDMTVGDWVVALICSGIGCIAGIVWCIQGKKKGPKMVGISLMMVVIWNVISLALGGGRR